MGSIQLPQVWIRDWFVGAKAGIGYVNKARKSSASGILPEDRYHCSLFGRVGRMGEREGEGNSMANSPVPCKVLVVYIEYGGTRRGVKRWEKNAGKAIALVP